MISVLAAIIVSAAIDSTEMQLGQQTNIQIEVTCNTGETVQFPKGQAQLPDGVECLTESEIDTLASDDGQVRMRQDLVITSFRDTTYTIRPFVLAAQDTVRGVAQSLTILLPEGVKQMLDIHDIKGIEKVGIWWWDVVKWILLVLGVALLVGVIVYVALVIQRRRQAETPLTMHVITRPAEEVALEQLDAIKAAKIWQHGQGKQYHTELTDVIRTYIGNRFDVHSTEKTSDETLAAMKPLIEKNLYGRLKEMLQLADLVKFAKYEAVPDENEKALTTAYEFVHATTEVQSTKEEEV